MDETLKTIRTEIKMSVNWILSSEDNLSEDTILELLKVLDNANLL